MKHTTSSAVETATAAFHEALRTNDAEALFVYVADDVLLMPPGEAAVRGKDAMRDWYAAFLSQYRTSSLTLSDREVFVGDQWAVELGSYEWGLTPAAGGGDLLDRGNYMQLWKSQSDGQWRFERERELEQFGACHSAGVRAVFRASRFGWKRAAPASEHRATLRHE